MNEPWREEVERGRNLILSTFSKLEFKEDTHQYFLDGKEYLSVSATIHKFEKEEDWDKIATDYAMKHGGTKEYWLDVWKFNNLKATTAGTIAHEYGESLAWMRNGFSEKITDICKMKYVKEKNWLIPTTPKEEAIMKFWDELNPNLHFVLAETKVYSGVGQYAEILQNNYAGTFDLLLYYYDEKNPERSGYVVEDYKTNKSLYKEYNQDVGRMLLDPFGDMVEEPKSLYTLQLSAYSQCLMNIGLPVIARRLIWLKDDGTFEHIPIPDVSERLMSALS